jgi:ABC-type transport system involved in multi-copper enzyme maturation permease subunit
MESAFSEWPQFILEKRRMFTTVVMKELKGILLSQKFTLTFGVVSVLILMSILAGISEYIAGTRQYDTAVQLAEQELREASNWMSIRGRALRPPDPLMVFVSGVHNDIGRFSEISGRETVKLLHSVYSDDPIFAVFRSLDLMFIVQVVLSLFAILFTYDAITGEREGGTLQLSLANPLPRRTFILAKVTGIWAGLLLSLSVPIVLGLLLVSLAGVPLAASDWLRIGGLLGGSLLYFTVWVVAGVAISTWTRTAPVSFMACLVLWICTVLILPRVGVLAAEQLIGVPTVAEVDAQKDGFAKAAWEKEMAALSDRWKKREEGMQGLTKDQREAYRDEHMWQWMQEEDAGRKKVQADIDAYGLRLQEDVRNKRSAQERMAFILARTSPAAVYQLAAMGIARTSVELKNTTESSMEKYRTLFTAHVDRKQQESGGTGGFRITVDSEKGFTFSAPRERGTLDISDLPRYQASPVPVAEILTSAGWDGMVLFLFGLASLALAVVGFHRYDVR